ncbi:MAG: hypothetical protein QG620_403 [Patescibacteria group bacterium]|nr:hypothetical protein [Patescibacteria group bacterium]
MTTGVQQRNIIIFVIVLFLASSIWLFSVAEKYTDPDYQKSWWAVYFADPKGGSLDFVIENHSDKTDFHYVILSGNQKLKEDSVKIEKGSQIELGSTQADSGKITIQVSSEEEKKEIYKNL